MVMRSLFVFIFIFVLATLSAQVVPLNPDVLYGKLDNGLTYYIQKNSLPKERAMFWLAVNAGAVNENEDQNGLAHFCEHMAFNGTKNFPEKGILNYLLSIGVSFGGGLNAGTGSDQTTYTLNNVPVNRHGYIDSALIVLREWAGNVSYTTDEINKERGVIHEEWRQGGGANKRMSDKIDKTLMKGSKYADHNVIGEVTIIDKADPVLLRNFYKDWYRPDLLAVIVVGDIDKADIKSIIEKRFSDLPKRNTPPPDVKTLVADNNEPLVAIATDKEASNISISMYTKHPGPGNKDLDYVKMRMLSSLFNTMFSGRISEILQKENPPFLSAYAGYGGFTKYQDAFFTSVNPLISNPIRSFKAALTEIERVKRYGFTTTELERARKQLLLSYERSFIEKDKQFSSSFTGSYASNFTSGSPAPGPVYIYELSKTYLPTVTVEQINNLVKQWTKAEDQVITVTGPEKEGVKIPSEQELKSSMADVINSKIEPYVDKVLPASLITTELKGSPVVKQEYIKDIDGTKLTLGNGATVWFKYTNNKDDEIIMQAFSNGGISNVPNEDEPTAELASRIKSTCGVGEFSALDLRRFLTGKVASVSSNISEIEEMLSGNSSAKDFETMLQLTYLQFLPTRKDDAAIKSLLQRMKITYENRKNDPGSVLSDTLTVLMSNRSPRVSIITPAFFDRMNLEKAYSIVDDRYKDASDFNFLFVGNVDVEKMKPLIEKYIGSIPDIERKEMWKDNKLDPVDGHVTRELFTEMKDPKATVYVHFHGDYPCTPENVEYLNAIRYILDLRYVESIREKEGGTYGVSVYGNLTSRPRNKYTMTMEFTCAPERADYLKKVLLDEITNLKNNGVTADEVNKTRENFIKTLPESLKNNSFILGRVKNYINDGVYTPLPQYSTEIYEKLDGKKIQMFAQKFFGNDYIEVVQKPVVKAN
jgi:zinc protease